MIQKNLMKKVQLLVVALVLSLALAGCEFLNSSSGGKVTVSFDTGTTEVFDPVEIESGASIPLPELQAREGYDFLGWYLGNSTTSMPVYDETQVYANITIYARWQLTEVIETVITTPIYQGMSFSSVGALNARRDLSFTSILGISDYIDIIPTEYVAFFANPSEEVLLTVNLHNPSHLTILRFTLNGRVYQNYEFQDGSDSEKLILKVNAQATSGIQEFTIDEIKYVDDSDNNTIKDVIFAGDKTIKLGVTYQDSPTATIKESDFSYTTASFLIHTTDTNAIVNFEGGMMFFVFDETNLVSYQPLQLGDNLVQLDNLTPGKQYQYVIGAAYDLLDGFGPSVHTLKEGSFETSSMIELSDVIADETTISMNITPNVSEAVTLGLIRILDNNQVIKTIQASESISIPGLLSNHAYEMIFEYSYGTAEVKNAIYTYNFSTAAYVTPQITLSSSEVTQEGFKINSIVTDTNNLLIQTNYSLYDGETFIKQLDSNDLVLTDLLSNHNYTVRLSYTYNAFDGLGIIEKSQTLFVKTIAKTTPDIGLTLSTLENTISYQVVYTDPDNLLSNINVKLFLNGVLVNYRTNQLESVFELLKSNTNYTIKLQYAYDLNDGSGVQTKELTYDITTTKMIPQVIVNLLDQSSSSVLFDITVIDNNATGQLDSIKILKDNVVVKQLTNLNLREFTNLQSNTAYQVVVAYRYDLNDGLGTQVVSKTLDFNTLKQLPELSLNLNSTVSQIGYQVLVNDKDASGELSSVTLIKASNTIETATTSTGTFTNLFSNSEYTVTVNYTYDANDGLGDKTLTLSQKINTLTQAVPNVVLLTDTTDITINYRFVLEDPNNLVSISYIRLYKGVQLISEGSTQNSSFNLLSPNNDYTVQYAYTYDLNDGSGVKTEVKTVNLTTNSASPKVTLIESSISTNAVSFDLYVSDINSVGHLDSIRLYNGNTIVSSMTNLADRSFTGLKSNTTYEIRATYVYDMNDGQGSKTSVFVLEITTVKVTPTLEVSLGEITQESVSFNTVVNDIDLAGQIASISLLNMSGAIQAYVSSDSMFTGILSNTNYYLSVIYSYNLNDGLGIRTIVKQIPFKTLAKTTPQGSIIDTSSTQTSVSFDYTITDTDQVGSLQAINLYIGSALITTLNTFDALNFENLLSSTLYTVELVYSYDLNDGFGSRNLLVKKNIQTLSKQTPIITFSNVTSGFFDVAFNYTITDTDQVGAFESVQIWSDGVLVEESSDSSVFTFDNLYANRNYEIRVLYAYDLNDGLGEQIKTAKYSITTQAKSLPSVEVVFDSITYSAIEFHYVVTDLDELGAFAYLEVYHNNQLLNTLTDATQFNLIDLLSNNSYTIKVYYTYDYLDGYGEQTKGFTFTTQTLAKPEPAIFLDNLTLDTNLISFKVGVSNLEQLVAIEKVELYYSGSMVEVIESGFDSISFDQLYANNNYSIKVYYLYNLSDGLGNLSKVATFNLITKANATPTVTFDTLTYTDTSVIYVIKEVDLNQVGALNQVTLSQNGVVIQTLTTLSGTFSNLNSDQDYQIAASYTYNLNDTKGDHVVNLENDVYTLPYLKLLSTAVINTEKITEGNTIVLEISVDNPTNIVFTQVMINGTYYEVSDVSTLSYIRVEFVLDSTYTGGTTLFEVQKIEGYRDSKLRVFLTTDHNTASAFIYGDILIESIDIVDKNHNSIDTVEYGQNYYIKVVFNNPTGYALDYIQISSTNYTEFVMEENNTVMYISKYSYSYNTSYSFDIQLFSYTVDDASKTKNVGGFYTYVTAVIELTPTVIYNASDLASIQSGRSYVLANDISLAGMDWMPKDISYVTLDGNGFSITDLRMVKNYQDSHQYLGIFKTISNSTIKNLNITNALIMATLSNSTTSSSYEFNAGLLAARVYSSTINNINVTGEMSINNLTDGSTFVGGVIGYTYNNSKLSNIFGDITLSADGNSGYLGGLFGQISESKVDKSYSKGNIYSSLPRNGGLVGYSYNSDISNSYSNITMNNSGSNSGGLFGEFYSGSMLNLYFDGELTGNSVYTIAGYAYNTTMSNIYGININPVQAFEGWSNTYSNVYSINNSNYVVTKTYDEIISIMSNIWDDSIWYFGGDAPQIRWKPLVRISNVVADKTIVSLDVFKTDLNQSYEQTSIKVYEGEKLIKEQVMNDSIEITSLMYNTTYHIVLTYQYSYGTNDAISTIIQEMDVTTLPAENTPDVSISVDAIYSDSVDFSYIYTDIMNYGAIDYISIYDATHTLIETLTDLSVTEFTNLNSNSLYTIEIGVLYDLLDDYGTQSIVFTHTFRTNPVVSFDLTHLLNTTAITTNATAVLEIQITTELNINFTKVLINDTWYNVNSSNTYRILVYVPITSNIPVGPNTFEIKEIQGVFEERTYTFYLNSNNTVSFEHNGEIYITEMFFVDSSKQVIEYMMKNTTYYMEVHLFNPSAYNIDKVTYYKYNMGIYQSTNFTINEDHTIMWIPFTTSNYEKETIRLDYIYYNNSFVGSQVKTIYNQTYSLPMIDNTDIIFISTAEELQNITSGHYYQLQNDIDLSASDWVQIPSFSGILDGNGYTISNLTQIINVTDEEAYAGLFKYISGAIIKNLTIDNFNILVIVTATNMNSYVSRVGMLASTIEYSTISNVNIKGIIEIDNATTAETYTGLLSGVGNYLTINNIVLEGTVSGKYKVAGLVGDLSNSTVKNVDAKIGLTATMYYNGNLVGYANNVQLQNIYVVGTMFNSVNGWANGGLIGYAAGTIINNAIVSVKDINNNFTYPIQDGNNVKTTNAYAMATFNYFSIIQNAQIPTIINTWDDAFWYLEGSTVLTKHEPFIEFVSTTSDIKNISFDIRVYDPEQVSMIESISIYKDGVLVKSLSDLDLRTFEGLKYSTTYEIVVVYSYNYQDELGKVTKETRLEVKTLDNVNTPEISLDSIVSTTETVSFSYLETDQDNIGEVVKVSLLDMNNVVLQTVTTAEELMFSGLLSNTSYQLLLEYSFDYQDEFGETIIKVKKTFTTQAKSTPSFSYNYYEAYGVDYINFSYSESDPDNVGAYTGAKLYDGASVVQTKSASDTKTFTNLYSNHYYEVELTYVYNLNDGFGDRTIVSRYGVQTNSKSVPTGGFSYLYIGETSLNFKASLNDYYDIGTINKIEVYESTTLVYSATDVKDETLNNLKSNTTYKIRMSYTYDLNDQTGLKSGVYSYEFTTAPSLTITKTELYNTEAVMIGQYLVFNVEMNNPSSISIESVKINGRTYTASSITATSFKVSVLVDEALGTGDTTLTVEEVYGRYNNILYTYKLSSNNSVSKFINGDIYVTSIELLHPDGTPFESGIYGETYVIKISFYNPTGYNIDSINLSEYSSYTYYSSQMVINESKTEVLITSIVKSNYEKNVRINTFYYSNDLITNNYKNVTGMIEYFSKLSSNDIRYIYTIDDLKAIQIGYSYKLMADIDLSGETWTPIPFSGVLDGNNHVISNLRLTPSYSNTTVYAGLFSTLSNAMIKDLYLVGFDFFITVTGSSYASYVGGLAGYISNSTVVDNVSVSGDIIVYNQTTSEAYTGLLAGYATSTQLNRIVTSGYVEGKTYTGGIVGKLSDLSSYLNNSYSSATFKSEAYYAGGLVGYLEDANINNSYANGIYSNTYIYAGGLVGIINSGSINNSMTTVKNSTGSILLNYYDLWNSGVIKNVYSLSSINTLPVMIEKVKPYWSTDIWSFGLTYPILRNTPVISLVQVSSTTTDISFQVVTTDYDNVGYLKSVELYKGSELVETATIADTYSFTGLRYSTEYTVKVVYEYNYNDEVGIQEVVLNYPVTTQDMPNVPSVTIIDVVATQDTISFDLRVESTVANSHIAHIYLYDFNQNLVGEVTDTYQFTSLYSNSSYLLTVLYSYDFDDNFGENILKVTKWIKTTSYEVPTGSVVLLEQNTGNIHASYTITDTFNHVTSLVMQLWDGATLVSSQDAADLVIFDQLYSNHDYSVKLVIGYDLNDQKGTQYNTISVTAHTNTKTTPTASLKDIVVTDTSFGFTRVISDIDQVSTFVKVELYLGAVLKETVTTGTSFLFENLNTFSLYTVKISYTYDKNDLNGTQTLVYTTNIHTNPVFELTSITMLNTGAISTGNTVTLELVINNPEGITLDEAVINGNIYTIDTITSTKIRIDVPIDSSFVGGDTNIVIEQILGHKDNQNFYISPTANNLVNTFINGDIYVVGVSLVDEFDNPLDFNQQNTTYFVVVEFYNPTGYDINSITLRNIDSEYTKSASVITFNTDKTVAKFEINSSYYRYSNYNYDYITLTKFNYSNERVAAKDRNVANFTVYYSVVLSETVRNITTIDELKSMEKGYSYILMNDLDLGGSNWTPISNWSGVLDGNGYTISNLTIVETYEDQTLYLGLFEQTSYSTIKNLTLDNVQIKVFLNTYANTGYKLYAGALIGRSEGYNTIINVTINATIEVTNSTGGAHYLGGVAGFLSGTNTLDNITVNAYIKSKTSNGRIGGLTSYIYSSSISNVDMNVTLIGFDSIGGISGYGSYNKVENVNIISTITGNSYLGGIISDGDSNQFTSIQGDIIIEGQNTVGGILGSGSKFIIDRVGITVNLNVSSSWSAGLVGYSYSGGTINNSFVVVSGGSFQAGIIANAGYNDSTTIANVYVIGTAYRIDYAIAYNGSNIIFKNVFGMVYHQNYQYYVPLFNQNDAYTITNAYNVVAGYNTNVLPYRSMISVMSTLFDPTIWDFENPIDSLGSPSLR